jgi:hypothetical protein
MSPRQIAGRLAAVILADAAIIQTLIGKRWMQRSGAGRDRARLRPECGSLEFRYAITLKVRS